MHEKTLLRLARIAVPHLETLEVRHSDRLDFHEVDVASLADALRAAYEEGRKDATTKAPKAQ